GSIWLDKNLNRVESRSQATFVARPDRSEWPDYKYFRDRWGDDARPVNYEVSKRPNDYAVAIEILSVGAKTPSATAYTQAMYEALSDLVADICARHGIPQRKGRVVGHEDVNPVQRYGWDPNQGFDWSRVWTA
ncbi:MAG TPA: N-acetylmuramoyl-L-alanine amidase, partial [Dongiaceae bacterium]|nr:N-acetylmuramoyl-L-alanine amidase [Dongiaceae bacterium]